MPDCSLSSGSIMPIMPASLLRSHLLSLLSQYAQDTAIRSLRPHGTNMLPYAHLIGVEVLDAVMRMYDSIALGHSCLSESSKVPILQGVFNKCRCPTVLISWHAIPGTMLPAGARPPLCHSSVAPRWCIRLYLCRFPPCNHDFRYVVPQAILKRCS